VKVLQRPVVFFQHFLVSVVFFIAEKFVIFCMTQILPSSPTIILNIRALIVLTTAEAMLPHHFIIELVACPFVLHGRVIWEEI